VADLKRTFQFMLSAEEIGRRATRPGETPSPLLRDQFSRRVHNEKVASVFKRFLAARAGFEMLLQLFGMNKTGDGEEEAGWYQPVNNFVENVLFGLKEETHALFRRAGRPPGDVPYVEDLFDVLVGSIFHEMMKIKENCYILEHYGPAFRQFRMRYDRRVDLPAYEKLFLVASKRMVVRATQGVFEDVRAAEQLFQDATLHLLIMLPRFANNGLVTRMLIENASLVQMVYTEGGLLKVLGEMYGGHLDSAWLHAAASYAEAGRYDEAREHCRKSLDLNPDNVGARRLMAEIGE
jgi:tetratricopeptide (TPR) repeat protein